MPAGGIPVRPRIERAIQLAAEAITNHLKGFRYTLTSEDVKKMLGRLGFEDLLLHAAVESHEDFRHMEKKPTERGLASCRERFKAMLDQSCRDVSPWRPEEIASRHLSVLTAFVCDELDDLRARIAKKP